MFCRHDYTLLNQFSIPSEFELVISHGKTPNTHCSLKRIIVTDYKCIKCGKLKRLKIVSV